MAKKFFYVCAGILMLAGAFALGARSVNAQSNGEISGLSVDGQFRTTTVVTTDGSLFARGGVPDFIPGEGIGWNSTSPWFYLGNVFDQPVNSESESMGDVKSMFR